MKNISFLQRLINFIRPSFVEKKKRKAIIQRLEEINIELIDVSHTCKMYGDLDMNFEQALKYKDYVALNYEYVKLERELYSLPEPEKVKVSVSQN
ncbi:hypothetical protein [Arcticibacter sp.]|uniref:hypothetical protein n=1 Tax=Arcticibacter sp. TaxID=1872630 RepID=UPI00388FA96C